MPRAPQASEIEGEYSAPIATTGNPAIVGPKTPKIGGFASPPFDGFADSERLVDNGSTRLSTVSQHRRVVTSACEMRFAGAAQRGDRDGQMRASRDDCAELILRSGVTRFECQLVTLRARRRAAGCPADRLCDRSLNSRRPFPRRSSRRRCRGSRRRRERRSPWQTVAPCRNPR